MNNNHLEQRTDALNKENRQLQERVNSLLNQLENLNKAIQYVKANCKVEVRKTNEFSHQTLSIQELIGEERSDNEYS